MKKGKLFKANHNHDDINDLCTRRTTSFAGIQITEESDEEQDVEVEKQPYQGGISKMQEQALTLPQDANNSPRPGQSSFFVKKNTSFTSLLSAS
jgi:hypothetical protein